MDTRPELYKRLVYTEWLFSGLVFTTLLILPESPRESRITPYVPIGSLRPLLPRLAWLLRKGKPEAAAKALRRLNGGIAGYDLEHELSVMRLDLEGTLSSGAEASVETSYLDLFKGTNLRRTLVSFSILGWQQTIGIPVVFGYTARECDIPCQVDIARLTPCRHTLVFFKEAGLTNPFLGTIIVK